MCDISDGAGGASALAAPEGGGRVASRGLRPLLDLRGRHYALRHRRHRRPHDHLPHHLHVPLPSLHTYVPGKSYCINISPAPVLQSLVRC